MIELPDEAVVAFLANDLLRKKRRAHVKLVKREYFAWNFNGTDRIIGSTEIENV